MDHGAGVEPDASDPLTRLRAAAAAVADLDDPSSGETDPMGHADRFEALHSALASALSDADAGDSAPRSPTVDADRG